jgi:hypothetical protein
VLTAECGDTTVLLCLETGKYHTLQDSAARIWGWLVSGLCLDEMVRSLSSETTDAPPELVLKDVRSLVKDLQERRLLEPAGDGGRNLRPSSRMAAVSWSTSRRSERARVMGVLGPSRFAALSVLALTYLLLRVLGLRRCLWLLFRYSPTSPPMLGAVTGVAPIIKRIEDAGTVLPLSAQCLERSLCALWFLRRRGLDAKLRIGVSPFPLSAHAWVEYEGEPVNENPEVLRLYRPFPAIEPDLL